MPISRTAVPVTAAHLEDAPTDVAPPVRWEPCTAFHADDVLDVGASCSGCGWPPEDHEVAAAA
jgi:hypothetical protein